VERVRRPKTKEEMQAFKLKQAGLRAGASRLFKNPDPDIDQRTGRPTKFKSEYVEKTKVLCLAGATNAQLADAFGVSLRTIMNWQVQHPEFLHTLTKAKAAFDDLVERSLAHCALGYYADIPITRTLPILDEDGKPMMDGKTPLTEEVEVLVRRYFPPNPGAALKWLSARRREVWSEKHTVEHTGNVQVEQAAKQQVMKMLDDLGERMKSDPRLIIEQHQSNKAC